MGWSQAAISGSQRQNDPGGASATYRSWKLAKDFARKEQVMLIGGTYRFRAGVDQRIGLQRFQAWKPPAGFTFQGHWTTADGMGGMFIAEANSAAAAFEATATFADLLDFNIVPVLDIMEAVPINLRVYDWIDSVG
jgi:hypothetical protein